MKLPRGAWIILGLVAWRLVLGGVGVYARQHLPPSLDAESVLHHTGRAWLDVWSVYDSTWFIRIAKLWYAVTPEPTIDQLRHYAFFPLYPGLIRLLSSTDAQRIIAGLVISWTSWIASLILLGKIVSRQWNQSVGRRAVILFGLLPASIVLTGVYSESLLVFCMLLAWWSAQRKDWWLAGVAGAAAVLTRSIGVTLLLPLLCLFWQQYRTIFHRRVLVLALIPLAGVALLAWSQLSIGRWDAFYAAQHLSPWNRTFGNPLTYLANGFNGTSTGQTWAWIVIGTLTLIGLTWRRLGTPLSMLALLMVALPLSTGLLSSWRMTAVLWPVAIGLALMTKRSWVFMAVVVVLGVTQVVSMIFWTNAYYLLI